MKLLKKMKTRTILIKNIYWCTLLLLLMASCAKDDTTESNNANENTNNISEDTIPSLNFEGDIISCSDFWVNQSLNSEDTTWLNISGTGITQMKLDSVFQTFEVPNNNLTINISSYDAAAGHLFCNDILDDSAKLVRKWIATSGVVKIKVTNIQKYEYETFYSITIVLENVIFKDEDTDEERIIKNLVIEKAGVGWLPG